MEPISIEQADAVLVPRGNTAWQALNSSQKTAALLLASDYIEITYDIRSDVEDDDSRLVRAHALLAAELAVAPVALRNAQAGIKSQTVAIEGAVSESVTYQDGAAAADPYPLVTALLVPLRAPQGIEGIGILSFRR